tara:strand:+ start:17704 stop:19539 length:1836 start_codon:yes stop_codon:yes gene_type:complete
MADLLDQFLQGIKKESYVKGANTFEERMLRSLESGLATRKWNDNKLSGEADALTSFIQIIDNEEGFKNAEIQLNNYKKSARGSSENSIKGDALNSIYTQKKAMFDNFKVGVSGASDYMSSSQFVDTASEFTDLQNTIDNKNKDLIKNNKKPYESKMQFLHAELAQANSFRDKIAPGFKFKGDNVVGSNFRFNKAASGESDMDVYRKLNQHIDRLNLAVRSLAGDKEITLDEAKAIMIGDADHYNSTKTLALNKAVKNYNNNNTYARQFSSLMNTAKQKKIEDLLKDVSEFQLDSDTASSISESAISGDWDKVISDLKIERDQYIRLRNEANQNYKNWAGEFYESIEGGMQIDDLETDGDDDKDVDEDDKMVYSPLHEPYSKPDPEPLAKEKEVIKYQDKHIDTSDKTYYGSEYQEFSRPTTNKEASEIATALGEKSYSDVKKKYLSANEDVGFPPRFDRVKWRPSTVKREDSDKHLNSLLESNNINISDIASYISNNNSRNLEKEFQNFLDNKNVDKNARDIISYFGLSTYKLQEGVITDFMAHFSPRAVGGSPNWSVSPKRKGTGWKNTKGYKKGNKKEIENLLKNYESVGEYEILSLLYEFMGTKITGN